MVAGDAFTTYQSHHLSLKNEIHEQNGGANLIHYELTYGPGIVQKLRAHFLELSKEQPAVVAHVRSPRFKRLKIAEIRRRNSSSSDKFNDSNNNSQDLIASGFTNKLAGKDKSRSSSSAYSNIQKVPGVHVGKITSLDQPNGIYIHRAAAIRTVARTNRKVKTFDSIREKFETCSNRCSSVPHKKADRIRFRRTSNPNLANGEVQNCGLKCLETQKNAQKQTKEICGTECDAKAMHLGARSGTVRVIVELKPNDDVVSVPFIVNQPPISPNVSSKLDAEQVQKSNVCAAIMHFDEASRSTECDKNGKITINQHQQQENDHLIKIADSYIATADDESGSKAACAPSLPRFHSTITTPTTSANRVRMPQKKQTEEANEDGLQEVHRLLKKFNTIREQRAKNGVPLDTSGKSGDSRNANERRELLRPLQRTPNALVTTHHQSNIPAICRLYVDRMENMKHRESPTEQTNNGSGFSGYEACEIPGKQKR